MKVSKVSKKLTMKVSKVPKELTMKEPSQRFALNSIYAVQGFAFHSDSKCQIAKTEKHIIY